jgi:hypothetical protein
MGMEGIELPRRMQPGWPSISAWKDPEHGVHGAVPGVVITDIVRVNVDKSQ